MSDVDLPRWLEWAREIQAIGQTGITYSKDNYDTQRYKRLTEIAVEIVQEYTSLPKDQLLESFLLQLGYATPKIDVRGAVTREGKILLVQERSDQRWCMPGGWGDVGETPSNAVKREVLEESGFQVIPRKIVGVYDANRAGIPVEFYHAYKIVFLCVIEGGGPCPSDETLSVGFFNPCSLPPLSVQRTNEAHIAEVFAHMDDENRPAALD